MKMSIVCAVGILMASTAALAGPFVLVKIQSIDKSSSYQVLTAEELKALQSRTALETRLYRQAEAEVRKQWRENEATRKEPFPGPDVSAPKVTVVRDFSKRDEAEAKLKDYEDREIKSDERKAEREKGQKKDAEARARDQEKAALAKQAAGLIETRIKELADKQKPIGD
jgi:hypothetical protein